MKITEDYFPIGTVLIVIDSSDDSILDLFFKQGEHIWYSPNKDHIGSSLNDLLDCYPGVYYKLFKAISWERVKTEV